MTPSTRRAIECAAGIDRLVRRLLGDRLVGTYLHGSAALGGFDPIVSDLDVLMVADLADGHDRAEAASIDLVAIGDALAALVVSAKGLELSIVSTRAAQRPSAPWPFVLHVGVDARRRVVVLGSTGPGDPDLRLHYAVARRSGLTISGPPPVELIGEIPITTLIEAASDELAWALVNAGEAYSVLTAGRAMALLVTGDLIAKVDAADWAVRDGAPPDAVERARRVQEAADPDRSLTDDGLVWVESVRRRLAEHAAEGIDRGCT